MIRRDFLELGIPTCYIGVVRTDVHEVGDTFATFSFGIAFKEFTNLKEQHNEDGFRKLVLGAREKTDAKGSYGSY